jgi:hypothetical protein
MSYLMGKLVAVGVLVLGAVSVMAAQGTSTRSTMAARSGPVSRTTKAVHYRQGGQVKTAFQATELMMGASGEAKIEAKKTNVAIDAKFQGMEEATKFGLEYLTYVLWAVSPEGRAVNLGELTLDKSNAHLRATTDMQTFGLIVTAEPYFAVNQPGNVVVLESVVAAAIEPRWEGQLYRELPAEKTRPVNVKLIPYFAWSNRGPSEMTVWLPLGR